MVTRGLCGTCVHLQGCIFTKNGVVWQCEEFSTGLLQNFLDPIAKVWGGAPVPPPQRPHSKTRALRRPAAGKGAKKAR